MRVRDWMTAAPVTIAQDDRLEQARALLDHGGFRHLPVVDAACRVTGMLTDRDLRQHHGHLHDTRVTGAMVEGVVTIGPDEPIEAAAERLLGHRIGALPVVDREGALLGIITETDLLRGLLGWRAGEEASTSHVDVELDAPTEMLAQAMSVLEVEGSPVLALRRTGNGTGTRTYRFELGVHDPTYAVAVLRQHGFTAQPIRRGRPR